MDKVLTRYTKGRLMAAVVMMALVAIVALPAFAYADAPFSGEYPVGSNVATPGVVAVDLVGVPALKASTAKITIGGTAYPTFVTQAGSVVGNWTSVATEQLDHSYTIVWTWHSASGGVTNATMYAYPPASALGNGLKNVTASVDDSNSVSYADTWSFTVALPVVTPPVTPPAQANLNAGCRSAICHGTAYDAKPEMGTNCTESNCHYNGFPAHGVTIVVAHDVMQADFATNSACASASCHGNNVLAVLPANWDGAGAVSEHKGCSCHQYGYPKNSTPGYYNACEKCHNLTHGETHGFGLNQASGHSTTAYGKRGAYEQFDGVNGPALAWEVEGLVYQGVTYPSTQSATTLALPASANMYGFEGRNTWGVWTYPKGAGTYSVNETGTGIAAPWKFPTAQVFWDAADPNKPADAMTGLTKDSVIGCTDCHTGLAAGGPQGAHAANFGLDADYPAEYALAELTKYVTANLAYASATNDNPAHVALGWDNANNPNKQVVMTKAAYDAGASVVTLNAANFALQTVATDSPYFTALSASGIAVRPAVNGNGVGKYDKDDIAARADGTSGTSAVICAKCHDLENEVANGDGRTSVVGSNTGHNSHHQDATDGSSQCVNCHIAIPHGWKRPRLLVNTNVDVAPYFSDKASGVARFTNLPPNSGYLWNGSAWVGGASNTANGAFTRIGMGSLSAIDSHIPVSENPSAYGVTDLTTVNTDNMVNWGEPDCEACNDHTGEGEIRIIDAE